MAAGAATSPPKGFADGDEAAGAGAEPNRLLGADEAAGTGAEPNRLEAVEVNVLAAGATERPPKRLVAVGDAAGAAPNSGTDSILTGVFLFVVG